MKLRQASGAAGSASVLGGLSLHRLLGLNGTNAKPYARTGGASGTRRVNRSCPLPEGGGRGDAWQLSVVSRRMAKKRRCLRVQQCAN